ncbi:hypothetical protein KAR91_42475 [Candidatus Pacearchaeota archaeon]|nr:hypothetical protein [Candidatus Pacearchaeota archaeon]
MFTKQHYIAIADVLRVCGKASVTEQRRQIICGLANLFARDDERFDTEKFLEAVGLPR